MSTEYDPIEICRLASNALDGASSNEELAQLEALLTQSAEARQLYYRLIALHSRLAWTLVEADSASEPEEPSAAGHGSSVASPLKAAAAAPSTHSPVLGFLSTAFNTTTTWLSSPKVLAIALAGGLATYFIALTISLAITQRFVENRGERDAAAREGESPHHAADVGSLAADEHARWAPDSPAPAAAGVELGRRYELASGRVDIDLSSGTELSIEGPAVWQVTSTDRLQFTSGKLIAYVPSRAVGFTVATPSADVVDLGTEFGVVVDAAGTADVHVFRGQVELKPSQASAATTVPKAEPTRVSAGQSRRIEAGGRISIVRSDQGAEQLRRELSPQRRPGTMLDLVDLLAGGDGNGRRRNVCIDPRSGNSGDLAVLTIADGDQTYHATPQHDVVDGCFIPNGATQIDSAGHRFDFPPTTNQTCYHFWAGQRVSWIDHPMRLGETDYSADGHVLLLVNPNKGLTLDLAAIRRLNRGAAIESLVAVAGNCIPADHLTAARPGLPPPKADLLVLVDGQVRFNREGLTPETGDFPVKVSLEDNDRFLTIAVTDGGDTFWGDWVILGDPRFVLRRHDD